MVPNHARYQAAPFPGEKEDYTHLCVQRPMPIGRHGGRSLFTRIREPVGGAGEFLVAVDQSPRDQSLDLFCLNHDGVSAVDREGIALAALDIAVILQPRAARDQREQTALGFREGAEVFHAL